MDKINLFVILAFKEQTNIYMDVVKTMNYNSAHGIKIMETTLSYHYFMLSKYFNIFNFYEYKDKIKQFDNAIIYHLPNGKDNVDTKVEIELLEFKGIVPIVMRSYDPHSPLKMSLEYMNNYHDFILTYLSAHVNNSNIVFSNMSFDNYLVMKYNNVPTYRKFACMILRRETRKEYFEESKNFSDKNINLIKIYNLREDIVKFKQIDIFGRNWPKEMQNYKGTLNPHFKKYSTLNEYMFNFIIENAIVDNFLSEKILDSFLSLSIPVYLGTPVVETWIPKSCFIDIRDFQSLEEVVVFLENMDEITYNQYIENILKYRDEIFEKFSTKNNFAKPIYKWYKENYNNKLQYSEDYFDNEENKIKQLKLKEENKLEVFIKRLSKYLKRKLNF